MNIVKIIKDFRPLAPALCLTNFVRLKGQAYRCHCQGLRYAPFFRLACFVLLADYLYLSCYSRYFDADLMLA
jgi:hypothetical protein